MASFRREANPASGHGGHEAYSHEGHEDHGAAKPQPNGRAVIEDPASLVTLTRLQNCLPGNTRWRVSVTKDPRVNPRVLRGLRDLRGRSVAIFVVRRVARPPRARAA